MSRPGVLALIPANNEADRIEPVISRALAYLPVLVVDDGSEDDTAAVAEASGATVVQHGVNLGKGDALRTGFAWAIAHDYEAVLTLDADGQHDPDDIPKFLRALEEDQGDLIIGSRDLNQIPLVRRVANRVGRVTLSWALGQPIVDNQSGFRLVTRPVLEILSPTVGGFEFEVEMIAQTLAAGLRLAWVPIRTIYADHRSHIRPIGHAVRFFQTAWRLRVRRRHNTG